MKIISHRGNLKGKITERENSPSYIDEAISCGYDVEVDVWSIDKKYYLGHDAPQHEVTADWLLKRPLWCHAKNQSALEQLLIEKITCFWHESDAYTTVSNGYLWCFPGNFSKIGITVNLEEHIDIPLKPCYGICTDFPDRLKEKILSFDSKTTQRLVEL